ncbi:MAG: tetratricopeptide repeat protein [Bacteroidota bacterium]
MPELRQGILQAKTGRWKESLAIFLDAIDRYRGYENLHKAYFDAGVAYEYTHQYSLAREFMERALDLSPERDYEDELRRCIRYEQEWKWREGYLEKLRMVKSKE